MLIFFEEVRPCEGRIITIQYDNGRVGFYFIDNTDGWGIVSFSGMKQEQHSPSENLRLLPIDALIIGEVCVPALGSCTFEDPYVGKARIECTAYHENGDLFSGFFVTDGSQPQLISPEERGG
jgi:hypothetical protein